MTEAATGVPTIAQQAAATQMGPVLVLAGAETGNTKTLTEAVVHLIQVRGIAASRVLVVTFTNKAASEMAGRIRVALGGTVAPHWIGTFHGLGVRQLRSEPEIAGLRSGFDNLDADDSRRIVKRVLQAMHLHSGEEAIAIGRDPLKTLCNRLSKFKDSLITPEDALAWVETTIAKALALNRLQTPTGCWRAPASMPPISVLFATPMPPISAISSSGPRAPCSRTSSTGNDGLASSTACWPTSIRT